VIATDRYCEVGLKTLDFPEHHHHPEAGEALVEEVSESGGELAVEFAFPAYRAFPAYHRPE
jgi:hypothetical protein